MLCPSSEDEQRRDSVVASLLEAIRSNTVIRIPQPPAEVSSSEYFGRVGPFEYCFEGEDDLLHVAVTRSDRENFPVEHAQSVISFLLPQLDPGIVWLKPGTWSHHFYFGHDELL